MEQPHPRQAPLCMEIPPIYIARPSRAKHNIAKQGQATPSNPKQSRPCLLPPAFDVLPLACCLLPYAFCFLSSTSRLPPSAFWLLPPRFCFLAIGFSLLHSAFYLLPIAIYPLHAVFCLMHSAFWLLSIAVCPCVFCIVPSV